MEVTGLYVYPVKSCRGVRLDRAVVTEQGLGLPLPEPDAASLGYVALDRQWCVCETETGLVQDIRNQPKLATLDVSFSDDLRTIILRESVDTEPDASALSLPIVEGEYQSGTAVMVNDRHRHKWFGRPLAGWCAGPEAAAWITRFIHKHNKIARDDDFQIVRFASSRCERRMVEAFSGKSAIAKQASPKDTAGFADCAPYHLLSEESLSDVGSRLPEGSTVEKPPSLRRFRPNIVVRGAAPYAEDSLHLLGIGSASFRLLGLSGRCVIPTTDPDTGHRDAEEEPRKTLMVYRPLPYGSGVHGGPVLGTWIVPESGVGTEIRTGLPVDSLDKSKL